MPRRGQTRPSRKCVPFPSPPRGVCGDLPEHCVRLHVGISSRPLLDELRDVLTRNQRAVDVRGAVRLLGETLITARVRNVEPEPLSGNELQRDMPKQMDCEEGRHSLWPGARLQPRDDVRHGCKGTGHETDRHGDGGGNRQAHDRSPGAIHAKAAAWESNHAVGKTARPSTRSWPTGGLSVGSTNANRRTPAAP